MKKIFISFLFLILPLFKVYSFPSCGSAACPLNSNNPLVRGLFFLRLSHEYIDQDRIFVGSSRSFVGAIPEEHDEVSTLNQITAFSLGYGLTDFLSLNFALPFVHREHSHIHHGEEGPELEHWNFTGVGDAVLTANISLFNNGNNNSLLNLIAGVKLATGVTDFKNPEGEAAEVTIQPGTGSTDFLLGAAFTKNLASVPVLAGPKYSSLPLTLLASYKINTKGTDDYMYGNELLLHLSTSYRFIEQASLLLQVNARFLGKADPGLTGEPAENTGGKWVFISPGIKFFPMEGLSLYGYYQIPVYQNVNGIQQAAAYNLQVGIQQEINFFD
ncbi:MAG TPA: transporter [Ignavibacteriaceae bacterium]|nr:transporter [Ignavibacteriaceae bacterium]